MERAAANASTRQSRRLYRLDAERGGLEERDYAGRPARDHQSRRRGDDGHQDGFRQQLLREACAAGAKRDPDGQLVRARNRARQQQVCDVGAREEEQQTDASHEDQRRVPDRSRELLLQRNQRRAIDRIFAQPRGGLRVGLRFERLSRLRPGQRRLQASDRGPEDRRSGLWDALVVEGRRRPEVGLPRKVEAARGDADDRQDGAVHADRRSDRARVAARPALPGAVADDGHGVTAGGVLSGDERPAPGRPDAEERKEVPRCFGQDQTGGLVNTLHIHVERVVRRRVREVRTVLPPRVEPVPRRTEASQRRQPIRFPEGQRTKEQRIDHAEDAGVRADRDGQNGDREQGRQRPAPPEPQRVPGVLRQLAGEEARHRSGKIEERPAPERHEPACPPHLDEVVLELPLERRVEVVTEARGIELQEQAIQSKRPSHGCSRGYEVTRA